MQKYLTSMCTLFLMLFVVISCSSGGNASDGDVADGDAIDGDTADVEVPDGDEDDNLTDGDTTDGEITDKETADGDKEGEIEVDEEIETDLEAETESEIDAVDGDDDVIEVETDTEIDAVDGDDDVIEVETDTEIDAVDGDTEESDIAETDTDTDTAETDTAETDTESMHPFCDTPLGELTCGTQVSNDNAAFDNLWESYGCYDATDLNGNEAIFTHTATCTGRLKLTLDFVDADGDTDDENTESEEDTLEPEINLLVLSDCDPDTCVPFLVPANPLMQRYDTVRVLNGETYYIVVDGFDGGMPFTIDTECLCDTCVDNDSDTFFAFDALWCPDGTDCDDYNEEINPDATEVSCDGLDNDCNAGDDCGHLVCVDNDLDNYDRYDPDSCPTGTDCNDNVTAIHPTATEIECDDIDQDCDGFDDCPNSGIECDSCDPGAEINPCKSGYYCIGYEDLDIPFCVKDCTYDNACPTGTTCTPYIIEFFMSICMPDIVGTCDSNILTKSDTCSNDLGVIDCGDATCNAEIGKCEEACSSIEDALTCGNTVTGNNAGGIMAFTDYNCAKELDAPELIYPLDISCNGHAVATLNPISAIDLSLLLLEESCSNDACTSAATGWQENKTLQFEVNTSTDYHLVVDSGRSHEGWFDLSLECYCDADLKDVCEECLYDFQCDNNAACIKYETYAGNSQPSYCAEDCSGDGICPQNFSCQNIGDTKYHCIADKTGSCMGTESNELWISDSCANNFKVEECTLGYSCDAGNISCSPSTNCLDNDGDGFYQYNETLCPHGNDCDDNVSTGGSINPKASEIFCNSIDEDCTGTDACPSNSQCGACSDGHCPDGYFCHKYPGLDISFCAKDCTDDYDCSDGTDLTCSSIEGVTPDDKYLCLPEISGECVSDTKATQYELTDSCGNDLFTNACSTNCYDSFGCYKQCAETTAVVSSCNEVITGSNVDAPNANVAYNCDQYDLDDLYQGERVYEYTAACSGEITARLKSDGELYLVLVTGEHESTCRNYRCLDFSWSGAVYDAKVSWQAEEDTKYYIIVEGEEYAGDFELSFTCKCNACEDNDSDSYDDYDAVLCPIGDDCDANLTTGASINPGADEIPCDQIDQDCDGVDECLTCTESEIITCATNIIHDTTVGLPNHIQNYGDCSSPYAYTGGEKIYKLVPDCNGTLHIDIGDPSALIVGFILSEDCNSESCTARTHWGNLYAETEMVSGEDYFIIVDGYDGAASDYNLTVNCMCD